MFLFRFRSLSPLALGALLVTAGPPLVAQTPQPSRAAVEAPDARRVRQDLMDILKPRAVAVIIDAQHMCMMMRGVEKQNSSTVTSAMRGEFQNDARSRQELLSLLGTMGPRR